MDNKDKLNCRFSLTYESTYMNVCMFIYDMTVEREQFRG